MNIANIEDFVVFGPASEWFWTMLQFAVVALTLFAIYRQLRAQSSANALNAAASHMGIWESEGMVRLRLAALMHGTEKPSGVPHPLVVVGNFFETFAVLHTHGHISANDSWAMWSGPVQYWWAFANAYIPALTAAYGRKLAWGQWAKLAATMADIDRKQGNPVDYSPESVRSRAQTLIPGLIQRLQIVNEAREGAVPTWPPSQPAGDDSVDQGRGSVSNGDAI